MMMKQWKMSSYTKTNPKIQNNFFQSFKLISYLIFRRRKISKLNLKDLLLRKFLQ